MSKHITGHTGLLCLLGSPVAHSVSPEMHNEACDQLGLDYTYLAFDVPEEKMPQAVEGLRTMGARGWNITMPGKNIMCNGKPYDHCIYKIYHSGMDPQEPK